MRQVSDPGKGRTLESPELSNTRGRSEDHQETRRQLQSAKRSLRQRFEAQPEGSRAKHQGQPQSVIKCYVGGHVTVSTDREEHWREPKTSEDSRSQRGPPGNAPAATGREEKPQTEVRSPSGKI